MSTTRNLSAKVIADSHSRVLSFGNTVRSELDRRLEIGSERGDVTPRTIMVFIFAALAIAVGGIITTKVTGKANAIAVD